MSDEWNTAIDVRPTFLKYQLDSPYPLQHLRGKHQCKRRPRPPAVCLTGAKTPTNLALSHVVGCDEQAVRACFEWWRMAWKSDGEHLFLSITKRINLGFGAPTWHAFEFQFIVRKR